MLQRAEAQERLTGDQVKGSGHQVRYQFRYNSLKVAI
jgi:hypothetical protein